VKTRAFSLSTFMPLLHVWYFQLPSVGPLLSFPSQTSLTMDLSSLASPPESPKPPCAVSIAESTYSMATTLALKKKSQHAHPETRPSPDTQTNDPATVDARLPLPPRSVASYATTSTLKTNHTIYSLPEPLPAANAATPTQTDPIDTAPSPPRRTRPQRHAAAKALLSLSTAYEPLVIHAARSERSSSITSAAGETGDDVVRESGMLVIDDMLPTVDDSEGDSDGYEGSGSRKGRRKRLRVGMKRKRECVGVDGGAVGKHRGKKRGEKLDRDDLRLIARAAQGIMGGEEKERERVTKKKKRKGEEMLDGLKRDEVEVLLRFVEESVDWSLAALRLSKLQMGREDSGDGVEQSQSHATNLEGRDSDANAVKSHTAGNPHVKTAESLKEHWRDILSKRVIDLYLA